MDTIEGKWDQFNINENNLVSCGTLLGGLVNKYHSKITWLESHIPLFLPNLKFERLYSNYVGEKGTILDFKKSLFFYKILWIV